MTDKHAKPVSGLDDACEASTTTGPDLHNMSRLSNEMVPFILRLLPQEPPVDPQYGMVTRSF